MPIERKDRSFDIIFDQISHDQIPAEYIEEIILTLSDGTVMILEREDLAMMEQKTGNAMSSIMKEDVENIAVKIDYDAIKDDVIDGVTSFLGKYFK